MCSKDFSKLLEEVSVHLGIGTLDFFAAILAFDIVDIVDIVILTIS